jgi:hypothetical protein
MARGMGLSTRFGIPHPTKHNFAALRKILKGPNSKLAVASDTGFMD